jgi:hypothetical protein
MTFMARTPGMLHLVVLALLGTFYTVLAVLGAAEVMSDLRGQGEQPAWHNGVGWALAGAPGAVVFFTALVWCVVRLPIANGIVVLTIVLLTTTGLSGLLTGEPWQWQNVALTIILASGGFAFLVWLYRKRYPIRR